MTAPNRIVLLAIDMRVSDDGEIEQLEFEHYMARAAGWAGPIIPEVCDRVPGWRGLA